MFGSLGVTELLLILFIVLLLFGAKKIPDVAASLGRGIQSFRKAVKEGVQDEPGGKTDDAKPPPPPSSN
jgi:sec-independent protein translocase protein TatA